jgi:phosphate starvation-inducible protein PhoH
VLEGIDGIGIMHFTKADIVRHPLVQSIISAYEDAEARRNGVGDERDVIGNAQREPKDQAQGE